jgi:hypothetical protein
LGQKNHREIQLLLLLMLLLLLLLLLLMLKNIGGTVKEMKRGE